ncbi:MAG: fatty acid--CoA ligase [Spirochaetes bacterium]|nr:fatty acid--CoA ligase [Spirochaetota bacterium]
MKYQHYLPGQHYDYQLTLDKLLQAPLLYNPEGEIVYRDLVRYTYRDMYRRIHKLAHVLSSLGVKEGDTVAVLDYDSHRYLECFFAIPMMGAVLQTVNFRLSSEQIVYTLNHTGASVILVNKDMVPVIEAIIKQLEKKCHIILLSDNNEKIKTDLPIAGEYEELLYSANEGFNFPELEENTKATTFYTTGTTGLPKGVYFTHRQLVLHTFSMMTMLGAYDNIGRFRSNDVYMPLTPMFHVHAWGVPYVATVLGVKQVYPGKYEPTMLLKLIVKEKVTFSHCVPTIIQMLVNAPGIENVNLNGWKVIIGGSMLPQSLCKKALDLGIDIYTGYGMSETCPLICLSLLKKEMMQWHKDDQVRYRTKTGLPALLVTIDIVDQNDIPLPHDGKTAGEVVFRAPWLTKEYYKDPEKTKELWRNGWLHSGDVGVIDEQGYLQITDRIKDVIKTGGEWISSLDLENILSQHPAVFECAAIGVPDSKWGERPLMVVKLKDDFKDQNLSDELYKFMKNAADKGKIPKYGVPERFEFVDEIPKTSVGKIDKKEIRKKYYTLVEKS